MTSRLVPTLFFEPPFATRSANAGGEYESITIGSAGTPCESGTVAPLYRVTILHAAKQATGPCVWEGGGAVINSESGYRVVRARPKTCRGVWSPPFGSGPSRECFLSADKRRMRPARTACAVRTRVFGRAPKCLHSRVVGDEGLFVFRDFVPRHWSPTVTRGGPVPRRIRKSPVQ